jgi:hypothetical protein
MISMRPGNFSSRKRSLVVTCWSPTIGKASLEAHEARRVDPQAGVSDAIAEHPPERIHDLGAAAQHLLGIAIRLGSHPRS